MEEDGSAAGDSAQAGGVQSIRRSAALLRALSRTPGIGARLVDLAETLALVG